MPDKIKFDLKTLKRINKKDLRVISFIFFPAIAFLLCYFFIDSLIAPSIVSAVFAFIIVYFWKFFKDVFSASLISIVSFLIIILLFFVVFVLLIKYNSGDIDWGVNVLEMFGLDNYFK